MPCDSRQASRQPHPPPAPTVRRRPMRSCCASPHWACRSRSLPPPRAPPCFIVPQSRHSPSLRDGTVTALGFRFFFFVHSGYRATSLCSDAPKPGSLLIASGASQTTAARRLLCPCGLSNLFFLLFTPCPGRLRFAQTALAGRYRSGHRDPPAASLWTGHVSALLFLLMVLREAADTGCAVTAVSLRSHSLYPASGRPRFPRTLGSRAFLSGIARQPLSPPEVGDSRPRAFLLVFVAVTRTPLRIGRDTSPLRALALETACADSRAPDSLFLRSRLSGRALPHQPASFRDVSLFMTHGKIFSEKISSLLSQGKIYFVEVFYESRVSQPFPGLSSFPL